MKHIIIKNCKECPHKYLSPSIYSDKETDLICYKTNIIILSIEDMDNIPNNIIPDWCPLDELTTNMDILKGA